MIDGNKIRCYVIVEEFGSRLERSIEEFCRGKQIIDIKYSLTSAGGNIDLYSALITYYIEH